MTPTRVGALLVAALLASLEASGEVAPASIPPEEKLPAIINLLLSPTKEGMFVRLPYFDTDPNRGITFGAMPIWVVLGKDESIRHIHIPSLNYNKYMGASVGYEYYYFPALDTNAHFQAAVSQKYERGVVAEYSTESFLDRPVRASGHVEYSRDGSKRFYGFGPNTSRDAESNYTLDSINYHFAGAVRLSEGSPVRVGLEHDFQANSVRPGAITQPEDLVNVFPVVSAQTEPRRRDAYLRASFFYDTRDSAITTSKGSYAEVLLDGAEKDFIGQYGYYRYGVRFKNFIPEYDAGDAEPKFIAATRFRWEQLEGDAPFWALPQMGGKYHHRGYGEGRYIDHGMVLLGFEQRCRVYARRISGTAASFWVDPFLDVGTVFPHPEEVQLKYVRPAPGIALRAVGRPQIVGSADFGYGQEGLKVFLDINYSF